MAIKNNEKNRVLIIGLDGSTFDLLMPWIQENKLPTINTLFKKGVWSTMKSTVPPISGPAWVSFASGMNPGKHGIYSFMKDIKNPEAGIVSSKTVPVKRIWNILDDYGLKSCIINLPVTYPPDKLNGVMISDFLTPLGKQDYTYPKELITDLKSIGYDIHDEFKDHVHRKKRSKKEIESVYNKQIEIINNRLQVVKHIMNKEDFDLFFVLFRETDVIQHFFWHDKEKLLEYFIRIDEIIKEIYEIYTQKYKNNFAIFIISDHGHGPAPTKSFNIKYWMIQNKYISLTISKSRLLLLKGIKAVDNIVRKVGIDITQINPKSKQAYKAIADKAVVSEEYFTITPLGIYIAESLRKDYNEYEKVREKLIAELQNVTDDAKACKVLSFIEKRENVYSGNYVKNAPDIVYLPHEGYTINLDLFKTTLFSSYDAYLTGYHGHTESINSIFIASGKNIKATGEEIASNKLVKKNLEIIDIAPTVLHLLGIDANETTDEIDNRNSAFDGVIRYDIFPDKKSNIRNTIKKQKIRNIYKKKAENKEADLLDEAIANIKMQMVK
ncbi:alkaline phosphatase family protein [Candidatus Woesearchaeota archaeon]|nr:alkaline phosphatase family protein [Candidatus Woesearchaeota archaeon]